jgi:hypothetical protein
VGWGSRRGGVAWNKEVLLTDIGRNLVIIFADDKSHIVCWCEKEKGMRFVSDAFSTHYLCDAHRRCADILLGTNGI